MHAALMLNATANFAATAIDFHINDTHIKHLKIIQFDTQGHLYQSLQTKQLQHIAQDNKQVFINPVMIVMNQQQPWKIKAQKMQRWADKQAIVLQHHVLIQELNRPMDETCKLRTEEFFYSPQNEAGYSNQKVTLQQGREHFIMSHGIRIDAQNQQVKFLSQVRGEYKPK